MAVKAIAGHPGLAANCILFADADGNLSTDTRHTYSTLTGVTTSSGSLTATGITASTTQTQAGGTALTTAVTVVGTVANANDTVTIAVAFAAGTTIRVMNDGANTLKIYPPSGSDFGAGVDTSTTAATKTSKTFYCFSATRALPV